MSVIPLQSISTNLEFSLWINAANAYQNLKQLESQWSEGSQQYCMNTQLGTSATAIVGCAFAIEGAVNWLIEQATSSTVSSRLVGNLEDERIKNSSQIIEKASTLDKAQFLLNICDKEPLNTGSEPYQSAKLLFNLRNKLAHSKPKMKPVQMSDGSPPAIEQWERTIMEKTGANPFGNRIPMIASVGERTDPVIVPVFPFHVLWSGGIIWAFTTSTQFVSTLNRQLTGGYVLENKLNEIYQNMQGI